MAKKTLNKKTKVLNLLSKTFFQKEREEKRKY